MPDISMCTAVNCRASETCRRHSDSGTIPTPMRQSYASFQPNENGEACDAYWHTNQMVIDDQKEND